MWRGEVESDTLSQTFTLEIPLFLLMINFPSVTPTNSLSEEMFLGRGGTLFHNSFEFALFSGYLDAGYASSK